MQITFHEWDGFDPNGANLSRASDQSPKGASCDSPRATPWVSANDEASPVGAEHLPPSKKSHNMAPSGSDPALRATASLDRDEVQVWTASLPPPDGAALADLAWMLSADEHERAERFRANEPRRQFVFGRAFLRQLLGACLNVGPATLVFGSHARGKPFLLQPSVGGDLRFNLSHSGSMVAIAIARGREVGVDIEFFHRINDWPLLVRRIFSHSEQSELSSLAEPQQQEAFFNGWTRKEAFLKAVGEGLTDDLPSIEVSLAPGKEPQLLRLPNHFERKWAIQNGANLSRASDQSPKGPSCDELCFRFERDFASDQSPKGPTCDELRYRFEREFASDQSPKGASCDELRYRFERDFASDQSPNGASCDSPRATPWVSAKEEASPVGAEHLHPSKKSLKLAPFWAIHSIPLPPSFAGAVVVAL